MFKIASISSVSHSQAIEWSLTEVPCVFPWLLARDTEHLTRSLLTIQIPSVVNKQRPPKTKKPKPVITVTDFFSINFRNL